MPELPEVESLAAFLREHASGHVIARAEAASFAVLKTFDPPLSALTGREITGVGRHGKFLDLTCAGQDGDLHLVFHLARAAGCAGGRTSPTSQPSRARARWPSALSSTTAPDST